MLTIVPDLNIFVFSIAIFDLIPRRTLVRFSLLSASYLYNSTGLRFYIFFLTAIVTGEFTILILQEYVFKVCVISFGFCSSHYKVLFIHPALTHSDKQQHNVFVITIFTGEFTLLILKKTL